MKLRDKGSLVVYNVPQEVGQKLVAAGLAVEVVAPVEPVRNANVTWQVVDGAKVGDFLYPPEIKAFCSGCGNPQWQSSNKGTAHLTMKYRHCGRLEEVPAHIAEEYLKRWTAYISRSRRKTVALPALTKNDSVAGSGTVAQSFSAKLVPAKG
jgi:hypothetical protein